MRFPGFIGPSYTASSVNVDCQRCMNLYLEADPTGFGKEGEQASLVATPGLTLKCTLPVSPVRGVWTASNGQLYAVGGQFLYSISSSWVATQIGQLNTSTGNVSMADNGIHLFIVDGTNGYTCKLSDNTYAQVSDPNFQNGSKLVSYLDGYFIFDSPNSKKFYLSDLLAVTFTGTNTASKEGSPDYIVGHCVSNEQFFVWGSQSMEVWYDSGDSPCPLSRIQGASYRYGCAAAFSIVKVQSVPYWLGGDDSGIGIIYRWAFGQPERISTPAIEAAIRGAGTTNAGNARAWTYQQGGHAFYCINIPSLSTTWCYDVITGVWHERTYLGSWGFERHKADCASVAYGANVVGAYDTGKIYTLDASNYTDNGVSIVRRRTAPHMTNGLDRVMHRRFQLDLETGVGLDGSPATGQDPQVMLRWSDDGGHTWSNEQRTSAGKIGKTRQRAIFRRLGASRDRVYEVSISDPVKVVIIGAVLDVEPGAA